jgi:hypothetical protein
VPAGSPTKSVIDVDGDGRPDTVAMWAPPDGGAGQLAILTAAGGGSQVTIESASPIQRRALVVNVDEKGPVEILLSDGRQVQLLAFVDCRIQPVLNPQGQPYTFDLFNRVGTGSGVGCNQTPTGRRLVGLWTDELIDTSHAGVSVPWRRTVVELDGLHARNGASTQGTFTTGRDDKAIASLSDISCGSLRMSTDGLTGPDS